MTLQPTIWYFRFFLSDKGSGLSHQNICNNVLKMIQEKSLHAESGKVIHLHLNPLKWKMWTLNCLRLQEEMRGNCTAGSTGQNCGRSPKDQRVITVVSQAFWSSRAKTDRQMDPRGQQELMLILLLRRGCSWYEYFCIRFYADEAWQGQWFSCHLGYDNVIGWPWQVTGVSCHRVRRVGTSVCALFCGEGHEGITSQTSQLLDFLL